jgi:hypothetical protein
MSALATGSVFVIGGVAAGVTSAVAALVGRPRQQMAQRQ